MPPGLLMLSTYSYPGLPKDEYLAILLFLSPGGVLAHQATGPRNASVLCPLTTKLQFRQPMSSLGLARAEWGMMRMLVSGVNVLAPFAPI